MRLEISEQTEACSRFRPKADLASPSTLVNSERNGNQE